MILRWNDERYHTGAISVKRNQRKPNLYNILFVIRCVFEYAIIHTRQKKEKKIANLKTKREREKEIEQIQKSLHMELDIHAWRMQ